MILNAVSRIAAACVSADTTLSTRDLGSLGSKVLGDSTGWGGVPAPVAGCGVALAVSAAGIARAASRRGVPSNPGASATPSQVNRRRERGMRIDGVVRSGSSAPPGGGALEPRPSFEVDQWNLKPSTTGT
jgi:hypothetical protein